MLYYDGARRGSGELLMHAINLFDSLRELSSESAERWFAAALAEAAALRGHDDRLYPSADDAAGLAEAEQLREAWRKWADDAEVLLRQVSSATRVSPVESAARLSYEIGRARAMLGVTPSRIQQARVQATRGQTCSAEEVRRELGLSAHR
jgi:hypothetical protein